MQLEGEIAVVTGAGAGVGRGIALALGERQVKVVVADIEADRAEAVAQEIYDHGGDAIGVACDVRDLACVEALADAAWDRYGDVSIIWNNAGVAVTSAGGVIDGDPVDLEWVLSVNLVGAWNGCSVFGKRFVERGAPAWIVNTASEHALGFVHPGQGFYTASKHALLGLSDVIRHELPEHVGISVFCSGLVESELWNAARNRPTPIAPELAPVAEVAKAVIGQGMPAVDAGRKAVAGLAAEEFLIVTHPTSRGVAERRFEEIAKAFDSQAPYEEGCERYDVNAVAASVMAQLEEAQA